mgnify:CR=1 FL=1
MQVGEGLFVFRVPYSVGKNRGLRFGEVGEEAGLEARLLRTMMLIRALENAGLGQGGQLSNFILIGEQGIVNTELRFPEELARHKILDILGPDTESIMIAEAAGAGAIALAAGTEVSLPKRQWHFQGPFGTYDRAAAQRGYQVYAEVCAACHSLSLLAYRNLMELGLTDTQVKGLIKDIVVPDLNDDGQPIERPARLSDRFRKPFPNELAAAAANNGKAPPDLSVIVVTHQGRDLALVIIAIGIIDLGRQADPWPGAVALEPQPPTCIGTEILAAHA